MRLFKFVMAPALLVSTLVACGAPSDASESTSPPTAALSSAKTENGVDPQTTCPIWQYVCTSTHYLYEHDLQFCEENCKGGTCKKQPDCL
jgi:hypothetical protein